ncbi:MAG: hypothetical protein GY769_01360 [bacterium]|nr:hypothetical protein [bacterium]
MARRGFAQTPQWLKLVVGLGVITTAVVAVLSGLKAAVVTATITFVALGAELAMAGVLDDEPSESRRISE